MKIGIITSSYGNDNYGGTLQAYAMQTALEQLGHQPFFVNTALCRRESTFAKWLEHPVRELQRKRRFGRFTGFWRDRFNMDPQGHLPYADYLAHPTPADAYVCGSDQIWSLGFPHDELRRKLSFADFGDPAARRIAYAPGWSGYELEPAVAADVTRMLGRFAALSAREEKGVELLRKLGFTARCVVDPTLLFDGSFWSSLASEMEVDARTTVLMTYRWKTAVNLKKEVLNFIKGSNGSKLQVLASERPFEFPGSNRMVSPAEWLGVLRRSEFVLTNSFHCLVFSIVFRRPFAVFALGGRYGQTNNRFETLLKQTGLEDRIIRQSGDSDRIRRQPVDWDKVDAALATLRRDSWEYLKAAVGEGNR